MQKLASHFSSVRLSCTEYSIAFTRQSTHTHHSQFNENIEHLYFNTKLCVCPNKSGSFKNQCHSWICKFSCQNSSRPRLQRTRPGMSIANVTIRFCALSLDNYFILMVEQLNTNGSAHSPSNKYNGFKSGMAIDQHHEIVIKLNTQTKREKNINWILRTLTTASNIKCQFNFDFDFNFIVGFYFQWFFSSSS